MFSHVIVGFEMVLQKNRERMVVGHRLQSGGLKRRQPCSNGAREGNLDLFL
jgi:hypothetical protein